VGGGVLSYVVGGEGRSRGVISDEGGVMPGQPSVISMVRPGIYQLHFMR